MQEQRCPLGLTVPREATRLNQMSWVYQMSRVYQHVLRCGLREGAAGGGCSGGVPWELAGRWHGASSVRHPHDLTVPTQRATVGARELGRCSASGLGGRRCRGSAPGWTGSVRTPDSLSTLLCVLGPHQDATGSHWLLSGRQEVQRSGRPWLRGHCE